MIHTIFFDETDSPTILESDEVRRSIHYQSDSGEQYDRRVVPRPASWISGPNQPSYYFAAVNQISNHLFKQAVDNLKPTAA